MKKFIFCAVNTPDKVLHDKAFKIAPKYDEDKRGLASMFYIFFDKKSRDTTYTGTGIRDAVSDTIQKNQQLANELQKPITRKFKKRKVYSFFRDNLWGNDLADTEIINKYNKWFDSYVLLIFIVNMLGLFH